jgi:hypothetical protein
VRPVDDSEEREKGSFSRRQVLSWFSSVGLVASAVVSSVANLLFIKPKVTYGPPNHFDRTSEDIRRARIMSIRAASASCEGNQMAAISTTCTHLGCAVALSESGLRARVTDRGRSDGNVTAGPAPKRLA